MPILKKIISYLVVLLVISYVFYSMFKTTDEIGFLGAGKVGRQVYIQTIDQGLKQNEKGSVCSEFFDRPFIVRFFLGEPLRTIIRFDFIEEMAQATNAEMIRNYMALPHETITDNLHGNIIMQEGYETTAKDLRELLNDKNVQTIEDFYAGLGFKKYEVYFRGSPKVSIELRNVKNVKHVGVD